MGNCLSTPVTVCCKKRKSWFPPSNNWHERACKRIKYTLIPRYYRHGATINSDSDGSGSPGTLRRSNAVRRTAPASRSRSSSPHSLRPTRLRVRNTTPPPPRPPSFVPTLLVNDTPSTGQVSLSRSMAPTSPTTVISSVHHPGNDRPTTLYMVDGQVIGSEAEGSRLELRWIDALRAPGAGGYRTVVDVVEERRSGRLTVVNGNTGRTSLETVASNKENGREALTNKGGLIQPTRQQPQPKLPEMVQLMPRLQRTSGGTVIREPRRQLLTEILQMTPPPRGGRPTRRALEEEVKERAQQQRRRQEPLTPSPPTTFDALRAADDNGTPINNDTEKEQPS
ncbi:MAG: hypothetical protein L6R39_007290, partial [Caloplaca ligustica]